MRRVILMQGQIGSSRKHFNPGGHHMEADYRVAGKLASTSRGLQNHRALTLRTA